MSELIKLANSLRQLTDEQIAKICRIRSITAVGCKDFFDLSESLNKPHAIQKALLFLSRSNANSLLAAARHDSLQKSQQKILTDLLLIYPSTNEVFPSIAEELNAIGAERLLAEKGSASLTETDLGPSISQIDTDAATASFETFQHLRVLIYDFSDFNPKVVGKNSISLTDAKRIASKTGGSVETAKAYLQVGQELLLVEQVDGHWQDTDLARRWLQLTDSQKLIELVSLWSAPLDQDAVLELKNLSEPVKLDAWLKQCFPFAKSSLAPVLEQLAERGNRLGIIAHGYLSSTAKLALTNDLVGAADKAASLIPAAQQNVILQADLSVVAPGPLTFEIENKLLKFTDVESLGLASRYRMNLISLIRGFEAGLKANDIEAFLREISLTPIPQPVLYLLKDASGKFGVIKVGGVEQAEINCSTEIAAAELLADSRLKHLALQRISSGEIRSRHSPELVWRTLRDYGIVASLVSSKRIIQDQKLAHAESSKQETVTAKDRLAEQIANIRIADLELGSSQEDDDISRQIQLAIKHRGRVRVGAQTKDGELTYFTLEPKSLANGRFRGMDKQADIERTLPLSSIRSIELA